MRKTSTLSKIEDFFPRTFHTPIQPYITYRFSVTIAMKWSNIFFTSEASTHSTAMYHCGLDGGQGLLKIGFIVTERLEAVKEPGRAKYSDVRFLLSVKIYILLI